MDRRLASKGCACELATAVGDDFVHVHIELRPASRHPDMQWEHVLVLARENLIASLHNESVTLVIEALPGMVGIGRAFLQRGVRRDHLPWDQVLSDAKVLQRTLRLGAPKTIRRDFDFAERVCFDAELTSRRFGCVHFWFGLFQVSY